MPPPLQKNSSNKVNFKDRKIKKKTFLGANFLKTNCNHFLKHRNVKFGRWKAVNIKISALKKAP